MRTSLIARLSPFAPVGGTVCAASPAITSRPQRIGSATKLRNRNRVRSKIGPCLSHLALDLPLGPVRVDEPDQRRIPFHATDFRVLHPETNIAAIPASIRRAHRGTAAPPRKPKIRTPGGRLGGGASRRFQRLQPRTRHLGIGTRPGTPRPFRPCGRSSARRATAPQTATRTHPCV
jgi:hypothetical protein